MAAAAAASTGAGEGRPLLKCMSNEKSEEGRVEEKQERKQKKSTYESEKSVP